VSPDAARADRNASIRAAARAWREAGAIDEAALAAVEAACPDDRRRVGPVFRVLLFVFTLIAVSGACGFIWTLLGNPSDAVNAALALAGMAWRWGYPLYAGAAVAALLGSFTVVPGGRLAWIALPLILAPFLIRGAESFRLPPSLRASCAAALGVALAGLYVAVNVASYDQAWLEVWNQNRSAGPGSEGWRALVWTATAVVPVACLAIGLSTRRYVFLIVGAGTTVASLITLRFYVHLAPLWAILTLSGALLAGLVVVLRRHLDSSPGKERGGFTAEPLFEDLARGRMLEAGAAVLSLSPEARPVHEEPRFSGGGGSFGGGGSSSEF